MLKYILKRVLIFLPTILVISLFTFALSVNAPGDPVEAMLSSQNDQGQSANLIANEKAFIAKRKQLGLDLPIFYFAMSSKAISDTLHRIPKRLHKQNLERFIERYGNWPEIQNYYQTLRRFELDLYDAEVDNASADLMIDAKSALALLFLNDDPAKLNVELGTLDKTLKAIPSLEYLQPKAQNLYAAYETMTTNTTTWKKYIPKINFYGTNNQYHRWFFGNKPLFGGEEGSYTSAGFIRGDFGISYQDERPVSSVIWDSVRWTMLLSFLSIIITYLVAIPLGVDSAISQGSFKDQFITTILFILYSLPSFWIATMAIVYFCGGDFWDFFPAYGVGGDVPADASLWTKFLDRAKHLVLPLFCWTYGSFAYLSRQMRGGMVSVLNQDYIRTARSKGLDDRQVIWKHALRNSLLPVITLFASVFPLMLSGSIALEIIFSIPGMGKTMFEAIVARNYPIVFTVMMFSSILTLVGYLVSDILYAVVDPRISYK